MAVALAAWQLECEKVKERCSYLLTSGVWSDCTFLVGSEPQQEVIQAHKLVLAMASPVFEAMLYGGMSERNDQLVTIPDIAPDTFRTLLQYVYTDNIKLESFDMACDLWYVANKYILPYLAEECYKYICSAVGPSNACQAYELASLFGKTILVDKCMKIISINTEEMLKDSSFEDVELETVITVCSLDYLNVKSELELFDAVVRFAEAEQRREEQIRARKLLVPNVKGTQMSSTAGEKSLTKELSIRDAIRKIRFLTMTDAEFAKGPARSGLLTKAESCAVLMNIASEGSAVAMPTGFSECRVRRQPHPDLVLKLLDEGRNGKPRPKPRTESLDVAASQLLTPDEIVRELSSGSRETCEQAARAARHVTCDVVGGTYALTPLVIAGGISALVAALGQTWTSVQLDAAWAITNIACDDEHAETLVKRGAVPKLVGLLRCGGALAEQAAWALGNIAAHIFDASDAILNAGAPSALLALMQPDAPSASLAIYVRTYRILCQNYYLKRTSKFDRESGLPYINKLLALDDEQVLVEACWVLYHMAAAMDFNESYAFPPWIPSRLTAVLRRVTAPAVQTAALDAMTSMLARTELEDPFLEAGCLDHIIRFLKCRNPALVQMATEGARLMLHNSEDRIRRALDAGLLAALAPVLSQGNEKCKKHAADAIYCFCSWASSSQLSELVDSAALEPYCRLLTADIFINQYVLRGLTELLERIEANSKEALLSKLLELEVPKLLIPLQQGKDILTRERANKLADLLR